MADHLQQMFDLPKDASPEAVRQLYNSWAQSYEQDVEKIDYVPFKSCTELFSAYVHDKDALVLDVGAGTGLTGLELVRNGFARIDALDISTAMLEKAREKGIYRQLLEGSVGQETIIQSVAQGTYDAAISTGMFTGGHVTSKGLDDMLHAVRPGGLVCFSVRSDVLASFQQKVHSLVADGAAALLLEQSADYHRFNQGVCFILCKV